jgi:rhodanese-related sulfurtransferase
MQTLTKTELKKLNDQKHEDFVLINVLPPETFREKHIRTSVNIPVQRDDFSELVSLVSANKSRKIVVYCASFDCDASRSAAEKLEKAGFEQVYDYEGGTKDWFESRDSG